MATSTKKPEVQRPLTERLDRTLIMDPKAPRPPKTARCRRWRQDTAASPRKRSDCAVMNAFHWSSTIVVTTVAVP